MNTCIFESPSRRPALVRHIASSLVAAAISLCMLSDAVAQSANVRFLSPSGVSGTNIYADVLAASGATVEFDGIGNGYNNNAVNTARLSGAPSGLEIASSRINWGSLEELEVTLRWTGSSRTVSADTTVTVQNPRRGVEWQRLIQYSIL